MKYTCINKERIPIILSGKFYDCLNIVGEVHNVQVMEYLRMH